MVVVVAVVVENSGRWKEDEQDGEELRKGEQGGAGWRRKGGKCTYKKNPERVIWE